MNLLEMFGDAKMLDINTNRFLTYAYTCIDQLDWNENKSFKNIEFEFFKYANIFPSSYKSNFDKNIWKHFQSGVLYIQDLQKKEWHF